jgi:hypothetical protein
VAVGNSFINSSININRLIFPIVALTGGGQYRRRRRLSTFPTLRIPGTFHPSLAAVGAVVDIELGSVSGRSGIPRHVEVVRGGGGDGEKKCFIS